MELKSILKILLVWQIVVFLVAYLAIEKIPWQKTFLGGGSQMFAAWPNLLWRANFDGFNFIKISIYGYGTGSQAFFPMYPNLIKQVRPLINPLHGFQIQTSAIVGTFISLISFTAASVFLVRLVELDHSAKVSKLVLVVLILFPASFFFSTVYTESLFLFLTVASFYFARTGRWWAATALAGLASYTRFVGIFLLPALAVELWQQQLINNTKFKIQKFLPLLLAPLGLLAYMHFLHRTTGDALTFFHALPSYGQFRSETVVLLYQVFWRYLKMLATVDRNSLTYLNVVLEFAMGAIFLLTSIWSIVRQRSSYAVFNALAYIAPTLTGSFVSLPRYVLACFPSFVLLAQFLESRPFFRRVYLIVSALIGVVLLSLFSTGYWVA